MKIDSPTNPHQGLAPMIPWEQRYLSCMSFIVYEVDHVACIVCRLVALLRQTCHANDFVNSKSHSGQKPLLTGYPLMKASFVQLKYWANKLPIHNRSISLATVSFYIADPDTKILLSLATVCLSGPYKNCSQKFHVRGFIDRHLFKTLHCD